MMAELFRKGGYTTGLFGKWHLGNGYPDRPIDRGFDKAIWFKGWGLSSEIEFDNDYVDSRYLDGLEEGRAKGFCTDVWFDAAMAWMDERLSAGEPFLTYLATNTPHAPHWPSGEDAGLYAEKVDSPATAAFFGLIANLDENVGRLERWLGARGAYEDTIVIFLSDNGGTAGRGVYNAGLRDYKSSHYEGGHRTFCFLRWPAAGLANGRDVTTPAQSQDLLPTLLDLCAIKPDGATFDGVSLEPLLRGGRIKERMFVVQYGLRERPVKNDAAVIWNRWRLQRGEELYDLQVDRGQASNVAAEHPEIVARMRSYYEAWWTRLEAGVARPVRRVIGSGNEVADVLTCADWWEVDCDSADHVIDGAGGPRGGVWHVDVDRGGTYDIELRRWPFHTSHPIGSEGPRKTISGRALTRPVRVMRAHEAVASVDGEIQRVAVQPDDVGAKLRVRLPEGPSQLQAWFRDGHGKDLCGAYYVMCKHIPAA